MVLLTQLQCVLREESLLVSNPEKAEGEQVSCGVLQGPGEKRECHLFCQFPLVLINILHHLDWLGWCLTRMLLFS